MSADRTCDHLWAPPCPLPVDGAECPMCGTVFHRSHAIRALDALDASLGDAPGHTVERLRTYCEIVARLDPDALKALISRQHAERRAREYQDLADLEPDNLW